MYIGAVLPSGKHITLTFNSHGESLQQYDVAVKVLATCAAVWSGGQIPARFEALERFEPAGVWVTTVESGLLHDFRAMLVRGLDFGKLYWADDFAFRPHVTMTKWRQPKQGLTGAFNIDRLSVVSDEHGRYDAWL